VARAEDIVKAGSGAVLVWGFLPEDGSPSTFIHRCFSREGWRESNLQGRLELCAGILAWPFIMPAVVGVFTWYNGGWVREKSGKGIVRQVCEQFRLAAANALLPPWYYIFELYDDQKRRRAGEYLNRFETKRFIYPFLRKYNGGLPVPEVRSTEYLSDKALFADRCAEFGLPAVPALMVLEHGRVVRSAASLPEIDLFVKLLRGTGGRGAQRWEYQGDGQYRDHTGSTLHAAALIEHLKAQTLATGKGCVVLPRLVNHPDIADLSTGALATVRAVTCRNERDEFEVTNASLRMAQGRTSIVDNFHAGGIVAKVDLRTGTVGPATDGAMALGPGRGWCERHPDTGGQIAGRTLPCWQETLNLARRAHTRAFSDHVIVGWDIAIVGDGPRLIEGNKGPDLDLVQKSHREPLGNARLGELLAFNLRRTIASRSAPLPNG
jgi:Sugar-transfer associated ATP-grasp